MPCDMSCSNWDMWGCSWAREQPRVWLAKCQKLWYLNSCWLKDWADQHHSHLQEHRVELVECKRKNIKHIPLYYSVEHSDSEPVWTVTAPPTVSEPVRSWLTHQPALWWCHHYYSISYSPDELLTLEPSAWKSKKLHTQGTEYCCCATYSVSLARLSSKIDFILHRTDEKALSRLLQQTLLPVLTSSFPLHSVLSIILRSSSSAVQQQVDVSIPVEHAKSPWLGYKQMLVSSSKVFLLTCGAREPRRMWHSAPTIAGLW